MYKLQLETLYVGYLTYDGEVYMLYVAKDGHGRKVVRRK